MDDTENGGGLVTGQQVIDGQSNNVFDDVSTLDRAFGAVNMRKLYGAVDTQTQDKYLGSHVIISKLPEDTQIGVTLFDTGDHYDRRGNAVSRVENYRAKGANYGGFLWATQFQDSKVVSIFQNDTTPVPGPGDVLYLSQNSDLEFQYIKIVRVDVETRTFTDTQGAFTREIVTLEITEGLDYDFIGSEVTREDTISPYATIKTTVVANAAQYYSARPLVEQGDIGDLSVKVDSIFTQLIPSSLQETAILDANVAGESTSLSTTSNGQLSFAFNNTINPLTNIYLGRACTPDSLSISVSGGTISDDGGNLIIGGQTIGTINYSAGVASFASNSPIYTGNKTVTFTPAVDPILATNSAALEVTAANRGFVWAITLKPFPLRTSLRVSYRAVGEWYTLFDNGTGGLAGLESGIGSGTINYDTGTVSITTGAIPDANTQILFVWTEDIQSGLLGDNDKFYHRFSLHGDNTKTLDHDTLTLSWNDGTARNASMGSDGLLVGDAQGYYDPITKELNVAPNVIADVDTTYTINYNKVDAINLSLLNETVTGNKEIVINTGLTNIEPHSLRIKLTISPSSSWYDGVYAGRNDLKTNHTLTLKDNGFGGIIIDNNADYIFVNDPLDSDGSGAYGIDYATGVVTIPSTFNADIYENVYETVVVGRITIWHLFYLEYKDDTREVFNSRQLVTRNFLYNSNESITVVAHANANSAATSINEDATVLLTILNRDNVQSIHDGSISLVVGNSELLDEGGVMYSDHNPATGSRTQRGTIDYVTGYITLTSWNGGDTNGYSLLSGSTSTIFKPVSSVMSRVPQAPVKPQSYQLLVDTISTESTTFDETTNTEVVTGSPSQTLSAFADSSGFIDDTNINGFIDYETGVVNVQFHADGDVNTPLLVDGQSMRFNAVAQTFIPLDAGVLGINPVRLPTDGRVPVYTEGNLVVVLHDGETTNTFTSSTQTTLSRGRQSKITVYDNAGQLVDANLYTVDLDNGTVDWGDLTGLAQPLTIVDRVEDLAVITDAQITGEITLSSQLTHDFPANETLVSSAIINGDVFATTSVPFDQQVFTGVWNDVLIGNDTTANYNNVLAPITVDNHSCIEERWLISFTSSDIVDVIGEHVGVIATGLSISGNIAPLNPNTSEPYFTIPSTGWGSGWSAGNVLRFNTKAANYPFWVIQSVGQGDATSDNLNVCFEVRGDVDTP